MSDAKADARERARQALDEEWTVSLKTAATSTAWLTALGGLGTSAIVATNTLAPTPAFIALGCFLLSAFLATFLGVHMARLATCRKRLAEVVQSEVYHEQLTAELRRERDEAIAERDTLKAGFDVRVFRLAQAYEAQKDSGK